MADLNRRTAAVTAIKRIAAKTTRDDFTEDEFGIQQELATLQMHYDRFVLAHDALMASAQPAEIDPYNSLWEEVEAQFNVAMAKLYCMLSLAKHKMADNSEDSALQRSGHPSAMDLKLDPLAAPKFDGTLQNWLAFKDAFETLVHSQEFPEAYKLGKLREAVQGDAVALVGGMYTGGYDAVWKALKARYDSPKQLAEIHVSRFMGLKQQSVESTSSLLFVVDIVRESFRALAVMKLPVDQWDALAVPIVTSKLPTVTQQAWGMSRTSNEIPRLEDLLAFVEKRAHSLASDVLRWNAVESHTQFGGQHPRRNPAPPLRAVRLVKTNLAATAPGNCEFCDANAHRISNCPTLLALSVAERFDKLRGSNLCFNCLRPGHATKACSGGNCRNCRGRHHTLLCRVQPSGTTPIAKATSTAAPAAAAPSTHPPRNYTT